MRLRLVGLGIAIVLLLQFQGLDAKGQTSVQTPFSIGSVTSFSYDRVEVTDKYVILGNTFETRYLDVATGKGIEKKDIDWPSIERWNFHVGKWWTRSTWMQTNKKNYTIWDVGGKHFASKDNMQPVAMSDGWFIKVDENQNRSLCTIKIIDSKTNAVILKFSMSQSTGHGFRAMIIDRFLVVSTPRNSLFFDKNTMKLEHVLEDSISFQFKLDGDYLLNNSYVISLKTFETLKYLNVSKEGAKLENGILYTWFIDVQYKAYRFWAYDLDDQDKKFNFVNLPIKTDQYKSIDKLWSMAGGLAYFQTHVKPGFEIIDPANGESLFFEPRDPYFYKVEQYTDNDRYIVSANSLSVVCYDTLERKLAWRIDRPMSQRSLGDDYYIEKADKANIRVFCLTNPLKSIKIPIERDKEFWDVLPGESGVIFYYAFGWLNNRPVFWEDSKIEVYFWNGVRRTVPVIENARENLIRFFLDKSDVLALMKEEKNFVLYKFDKSAWTKVFSQSNDSTHFSYSVDNGRMVLRTSDTRAVIVDFAKFKITRVLEVKAKTSFWLKDGFLVENVDWKTNFVTHILTGQMVRGGEVTVLDVQGDTVCYTYDGAIGVINGNQYTEAKIEGIATSAAGGLFANDNWLFDSNGRVVQGLPYSYGKLKMIAGKLHYYVDRPCIATVKLDTPAAYKITKTPKGFELTCTGLVKLQGKAWVVKDTGDDFLATLEEGTGLDLATGKSIILPNIWQDESYFVVVQSNGYLDSTCLSDGQNEYANPLWNGKSIGQSSEIFSMTKWGGK